MVDAGIGVGIVSMHTVVVLGAGPGHTTEVVSTPPSGLVNE